MSNPVTMYEYHAWANQAIFDRLKELPPELFHQQVQSVFPSISRALSHIYAVDYCWLSVLSGVGMGEALQGSWVVEGEAQAKSLTELEKIFGQLRSRYLTFFQEKIDLEESIVLDNPYAGIRVTRLSEIILHVSNHGTYHRGNIAAMLRQMGQASTMTDYALFWYRGTGHKEQA